jgi:hypothetical protein
LTSEATSSINELQLVEINWKQLESAEINWIASRLQQFEISSNIIETSPLTSCYWCAWVYFCMHKLRWSLTYILWD